MNESLVNFTKIVSQHITSVLEDSELKTVGVVHDSSLHKHLCLCEVRFVNNDSSVDDISINNSADIFKEITNRFSLENNDFQGIGFLLAEKLFHCYNDDRVYILRFKEESLWNSEEAEYISKNIVSDIMAMNSK